MTHLFSGDLPDDVQLIIAGMQIDPTGTATTLARRIAELEAVLMQVAAFSDAASDANWRDIILLIQRQISEIQPAS